MIQPDEPKALNILEIGDGKDNLDKLVGTYTLDKPHPGYGKDPNVINQLGHTLYPKWIDSKIEGKRVIVNSPHEEAQHTGEDVKPGSVPAVKTGNDW